MKNISKQLAFVTLLLIMSFFATSTGYAMEKTNVYIAIDESARQYDHVIIKTVSLGRTNRETLITLNNGNNAIYSQYLLMNHVYPGELMVNALWFERGPSDPVANVSTTISEETLLDKARAGGINLIFYPDRIEVQ